MPFQSTLYQESSISNVDVLKFNVETSEKRLLLKIGYQKLKVIIVEFHN